MTAISAVQSLYSPITNSLYPHMVMKCDFRFIKNLALIAFPAVLAGTVAFAMLRDVIFMILGGAEYLPGSWVAAAVSPVLFFSFFGMLFGWPVLGAAGKIKEITSTTVLSSLFCIASLLAASILRVATMQIICVIRCLTEAVLCALRVWFAVKLLFLPKSNAFSKPS